MIPRKRLQVLLHVLQIFYVFGDGDPGSEAHHRHHHHLQHLADDKNLIDSPEYTTDFPPAYHHIQERVTSREETDDGLFDLQIPTNFEDEPVVPRHDTEVAGEEYANIDEDNFDAVNNMIYQNVGPAPTVAPTIIETVTITQTQSTALNVTWTVSSSDENNTTTSSNKFVVNLYESEDLKANFSTDNTYLYIKDLEPCTEYRVEVSLGKSAKSATGKTSHERPNEPRDLKVASVKTVNSSSALQVTWSPPLVASKCVAYYKVRIDNIHEVRDLRELNTTETICTFEDVFACRTYEVTVFTFALNGEPGAFVKNETIVTSPDATEAPRLNETHVPKVTKDSIGLLWIVASAKNKCPLKSLESECRYNVSLGSGYKLKWNNRTVGLQSQDNPASVPVTIDELSPYTQYLCRARAIVRDLPYDQAASPWSVNYTSVTAEDVPSVPGNFHPSNKEISKWTFKWDEPNYRPGKFLGYRIKFRWQPNYTVPDDCDVDRERIVNNIDGALTEYSLIIEDDFSDSDFEAAISAGTNAGWSDEVVVKDYIMQRGVPDQVTSLHVEIMPMPNDSNTLDTVLYWKLPCIAKGWLYSFDVGYNGTREGLPVDLFEDVLYLPDKYEKDQVFEFHFGELKPLYTYVFLVSATLYGTVDSGETANTTIVYPPGIPPQPKEEYIRSITLNPQKSPRSTSKAFVLLPVFPQDFGEIKHYAVMVAAASFKNESARFEIDERKKSWPDVRSWEESKENNFRIPYQATVSFWKPSPESIADYGDMKAIKFEIGDDLMCPQVSANTKDRVYCNGPLNPDSWYEVRMRAFTARGYADSASFAIKTNAELNVGLVLGVIFGILFIGTTTALVLMIKRCSVRLLVQRILQATISESPVPSPMTRRKFMKHCQQLAENPAKLANEFQLLQTLSVDLQMPSNHACLQGNRKKNRYSDILPYDFSRVKLEVIDNDPCSDYINASYIKGYSGDDEYIACQGPKEDTTLDFWRMIDQYDVKIILMLTQLVERGKEKCHQYFPMARETFTYDKFSIKCTSELDYRNYTQRTLVLENFMTGVKRTITHWHFKDWPDHDVPDDFDAMLHFVQMFRKQLNSVKGLAVIHCSAGIGRTGTLIAIDILLQSLKDCRKIDVFGTVYRLRKHRLNMVQRESQYAYIYNCIRQVLKNPYFSKTYKPPPMDPTYAKAKPQNNDRSDSSTDLVESFDTLKKNSLSNSMDSTQPLCQSSPQATPKIQMNGLRYCRSTSAIDTRSNHNRIEKYNSDNYIACETRDSFSTNREDSAEDDGNSSSSTVYENIEPLIRTGSSQSIAGASYIPLMNDIAEKDTSL
ncbi:tyrosine-protein phosphatase 10D isoform X2 [Copidosoma floridanum]|uniref:tyrosine-protein phosphatase 10D isoform X2 n=1 Tax=Copidosoma floridanum TaxID=29053 RepID=UPI0006C96747|nr:tyrosine-protein phosphatase 10D isoform X2 [Copidosoma floridanum]